MYLKAQVTFLREGPNSRKAQDAMAAAIRFNPHVIETLLSDEPRCMPEHYTLGSIEEAIIVLEEQLASWTETRGFVDWMLARFTAWSQERMKHDREKKRKLRAKAKKQKQKKSRK